MAAGRSLGSVGGRAAHASAHGALGSVPRHRGERRDRVDRRTPRRSGAVAAQRQPARTACDGAAWRGRRSVGAGSTTVPGPTTVAGATAYVEVDWDEALDLAAAELRRVRDDPRQRVDLRRLVRLGERRSVPPRPEPAPPVPELHRRLHVVGQLATRSARSEVLLPHVIGAHATCRYRATTLADDPRAHRPRRRVRRDEPEERVGRPGRRDPAHARPVASPRPADAALRVRADQPAARRPPGRASARRGTRSGPGTDTAVMLGLAHVAADRGPGRHRRSSTGTPSGGIDSTAYVSGDADGSPKTPEWAAVDLGRRRRDDPRPRPSDGAGPNAGHGQLVDAARRARRAAGVDGRRAGRAARPDRAARRRVRPRLRIDGRRRAARGVAVPAADVPAGSQPGRGRTSRSPGSRDLLDRSRASTLDFNGDALALPDIRLVYWAGGNPFHHHQDLFGCGARFARPDTVDRARAVLDRDGPPRRHRPAGTTYARARRRRGRPQRRVRHRDAPGARRRSASRATTTRSSRARRAARRRRRVHRRADAFDWLEHMYDGVPASSGVGRRSTSRSSTSSGSTARLGCRPARTHHTMFEDFRADPTRASAVDTQRPHRAVRRRRSTASATTTAPAIPTWIEPVEWLGGRRAARVSVGAGGEPAVDAAARPARRRRPQPGRQGRRPRADPDPSGRRRGSRDLRRRHRRVFNDRGACLAGAVVTDEVRPSVVQLSTGAWFEPVDRSTASGSAWHGNPNVLTADRGTSRLAQGSIGQLALVEVERFDGEAPLPQGHVPPID